MSRVLIVEDNPALRKIYITLLTKEGYQVDFAGDGQEALDKAAALPPDLILLDLRMPRLDGIEFLRAYDVRNRHPEARVVVFSNTERPDDVLRAKELGAVRYMTKYNVTPKVMMGVFRQILAEPSTAVAA
jgi:CheY-like chemotaxis protein